MVNYFAKKTCSLFGHRKLWNKEEVAYKLKEVLEKLVQRDYFIFKVGNHGEFDRIAIYILKELKKKHTGIEIYVVITNFYVSDTIKDENINVLMYEIEFIHPKRRILFSNYKMVDESDMVLFYVDPIYDNSSGAKRVLDYAIKTKKKVLNLY